MSKRRTLVTVDSKALQVLYSSGFVSFLNHSSEQQAFQRFCIHLGSPIWEEGLFDGCLEIGRHRALGGTVFPIFCWN